MTLGDLLQELRENILHDRSDQVAGASDYLWSDATLVRYINQAQRRFARRSCILRDASTPEVTVIKLISGQTIYPLHKSVIAVLSAKYSTDVIDLARAGHAAFGTYQQPDARFFNPAAYSSMPPGKVVAYSTDEDIGQDDDGRTSVVQLRVYPAPSDSQAGALLNLRVVRLPLQYLSLQGLDDELEVPEDYQLDMLDWAAYLALRIDDLDGSAGDAYEKAQNFAKSFEQHCVDAKKEAMRKMFTPQLWGFGKNGYSWVR